MQIKCNFQNTTLNIINDPAFRTIMVIELKRFSPQRNDSAQFKSSLNNFNHAFINVLNSYEGTLVKQTEGYFLVSFKSVTNAVHAALDIHSKFKKFLDDINENRIFLKIGLSSGVPVTDKKLIFEDYRYFRKFTNFK